MEPFITGHAPCLPLNVSCFCCFLGTMLSWKKSSGRPRCISHRAAVASPSSSSSDSNVGGPAQRSLTFVTSQSCLHDELRLSPGSNSLQRVMTSCCMDSVLTDRHYLWKIISSTFQLSCGRFISLYNEVRLYLVVHFGILLPGYLHIHAENKNKTESKLLGMFINVA